MTLVNSQENEIDLVELENQRLILDRVEDADLKGFGPFYIVSDVWKRMLLHIRSYALEPASKQVAVLLLGQLVGPKVVIKDFVQLIGRSDKNVFVYDVLDIKKVEKQAYENRLMLAGVLHTCTKAEPKISYQDRVMWFSLIFEFSHPLTYMVINPETLDLTAYSISPQNFTFLKEALAPVHTRVEADV